MIKEKKVQLKKLTFSSPLNILSFSSASLKILNKITSSASDVKCEMIDILTNKHEHSKSKEGKQPSSTVFFMILLL